MNTVRKLRIMHMYLIRNGYSDTDHTLWLFLQLARGNKILTLVLVNWLNGNGSIDPLLTKTLFLFDVLTIIRIKSGIKSLKKLMAVLPINGETK